MNEHSSSEYKTLVFKSQVFWSIKGRFLGFFQKSAFFSKNLLFI